MLYAIHNTKRRPSPLSRAQRGQASQRGQSIVVALLVLLLLGLAGALFVTIVARNILNANKANRVLTADQYSRAGIVYADSQLSSSLDGADWRPPLQFALAVAYVPTEAREQARYTAAVTALNLQPDPAADPDKAYLDAGYTRYNTGAGRFLLRLTYDPVNVLTKDPATGLPSPVPPGKYIKIEAIGREGTIDTLDPTTYTNNRSSDRTQSYQVAYKPIGITDYARFETNPDKRSDIANLGVISEFYAADTDGGIATPGASDFDSVTSNPPTIREYSVRTTYGAPDAYIGAQPNPNAGAATSAAGAIPGGGSIHANMPVRFFGKNIIYLNDAGTNPTTAGTPLFQDSAEVAGNLLLDNYNDNNPLSTTSTTAPNGQQAALILNPTDLTKLATTGTFILPSNSTKNGSFDTHGGLIRDGSMQNDPEGLPRGITRLEPPLMDATDSASQLPRYKALTMNSAPRSNLTNPDGTPYTPGANAPSPSLYGYGKDIYVNNTADTQPDSTSIGGGSTLTDEWLHGNAASNGGVSKGNWNGHFYDPPGVSIILGQLITPATTTPANSPAVFGLRLIRSAGDQWVGPDGTTNAGPQLDVKYSDLDTDLTGAGTSDNDIVIYAEGNVRVRGTLSPNEGTGTGNNAKFIPRHITIVTNGTAYIEGNLLKGDPDSSITVLAHDYVCVNTTQFLAGPTTQEPPVSAIGSNLLEIDDTNSLTQEFNFGLRPNVVTTDAIANGGYGGNPYLYISGASNSSSTLADLTLQYVPGAAYMNYAPVTLTQVFSSLTPTRLTFPLTGLPALGQSDLSTLTVARDPNDNPSNPGDVLLERVAILPMDIRIEAVLYAQTRSFFVIPGEWFNSDPTDNLDSYQHSVDNTNVSGVRPSGAQNSDDTARFPMSGQPIDLKITIDGSVSEARPADIAAQTEWMKKWGWIPQYHGTLIGLGGNATELSGRVLPPPANQPIAGVPSIGLQIIYNPQAGYPYDPTPATGAAHYLRSDKFGRPLPFTPNLPVSTGLLYSGESGEPPLLQ